MGFVHASILDSEKDDALLENATQSPSITVNFDQQAVYSFLSHRVSIPWRQTPFALVLLHIPLQLVFPYLMNIFC